MNKLKWFGSWALCVALSGFLMNPVFAQDYVVTPKGKISDKDFYRVLSCGAPLGAKCRIPPMRWSKSDRKNITLRVVKIEENFPKRKAKAIFSAIKHAVKEVNGVGAGVRLSLIETGNPDIPIVLTNQRLKTRMRKPSNLVEHIISEGAVAMVRVTRRGRTETIEKAQVFYTEEMPRSLIKSIVLEEIVQGLGLIFDIHNRYYERKSVFSETGGRQTRLKGQDAKALLFHYPK